MKYIFKNFFSRFWKTPKFHDFVFSFPVFGRNDFHLLPRLELFFPRKEKSSLFKKNLFFYLTN